MTSTPPDSSGRPDAPTSEPDDAFSLTPPQSEELFMMVFRTHPSVMLLVDAETGNLVDVNAAAAGQPSDCSP
jgi:hypothetical protein